MTNLHVAAINAYERNRKTAGLTVSIDNIDTPPKKEDNLSFVAVVTGGTEPETAEILLHPGRELGAVHCTCKDFQFTWYPYYAEQGENIGEYPQYENKSNTSATRAVAVPGMCKHLLALYEFLVNDDVIPKLEEKQHG